MSIRESYLYVLWTAIYAAYEDSGVHRFLMAAGRWCNRQIDESALLGILCRKDASPAPGRTAFCAGCWLFW